MRIASVLLVAVLLSTSVISGTFAKYTTTGTGSDTARVAKWGVTVTATGTTFAKAYDTDDNSATVKSASEEKVVAPGTKGTMVATEMTGTPEVSVAISFEGKVTLNNWIDSAGNFYCPLVITVAGEKFDGLQCSSAKELIDKIEAKIKGQGFTCHAGSDMENMVAPSVIWEWPFETQNDAKDTYLGNQAANGTVPTISISLTTTVTQVD